MDFGIFQYLTGEKLLQEQGLEADFGGVRLQQGGPREVLRFVLPARNGQEKGFNWTDRPQSLGDFHSLYETGLDYRQHAASKVVEGGTVLLGGQAAKAGKKVKRGKYDFEAMPT